MRSLRMVVAFPWFHAGVLTVFIALAFYQAQIVPMDDHDLYRMFIETLATGKVDFSIPGFHGASFLALPLYLITRSPLTNIYFQILCALLIVPAATFAASSILRDKFQTILFTYIIALMPFLFFFSLRGFTFPSFTLFLLLTIGLRGRGSKWAWLPWSISMLIKPFSAALLPLFLLWSPGKSKKSFRNNWLQIGLAAILPILYFGAEYLQIGHIIIGAHQEIDQSNVFQLWRLPLNAAHGIQILFSVHNFYFPDPAKTSLGNMLHSSPILMLLGVLSYLYPKEFWPPLDKSRRLALALGASAALAFLLASALDHLDQFYIETCVILLALGSIPVLIKYKLLIPLVLATLHFQFFYLYLQYRNVFFVDFSLFAVVAIVDVAFAVMCGILAWNRRKWFV